MRRVGIIGAGISGLSLAYFLKKKGFDVVLIESSNAVGGPVHSTFVDSFLIEHGPNSLLLTSPIIQELIDDLGLSAHTLRAKEEAKFRFIVKNGKLVALPTSLGSFLKTSLFSLSAKLRLLKEPFVEKGTNKNESLADFVERRLGKEFLDYAINPFVAGVYAGNPRQLSVRHAFAKLFELEQEYGSLVKGQIKGAKERKQRGEVAKNRAPMISFTNGLGELIEKLTAFLGDSIQKNQLLESIFKVNDGWTLSFLRQTETIDVDFLVSTIPSHRLHELPFTRLIDDSRARFKQIYYPPVTVVHTGYAKHAVTHPLNGFGFLCPEVENRNILGGLFASSVFAHRADQNHHLITNFVGGAREPEMAFKEDDELCEIVFQEHKELLGAKEKPIFTKVIRWKQAIPQYTTDYDEVKDGVSKMETGNAGLFLSGNWVNGISLSDSITKAAELADRIEKA